MRMVPRPHHSAACTQHRHKGFVSERGHTVSEHEADSQKSIGTTPLTRRQLLKGALAVGGAAAFAPALAACGGGGGTSTSPSTSATAGPKQGGALKVGIVGGSAKERLDGALATTEPEICNCFQLYDALMGWDENYQMVQLLAESATPNADASVWTVKLRSGVTFHDGKPLTADDVVFSYTRIIDPKNPLMGASQLSSLKASGIKKVDAQHGRVHPHRPERHLR